MTPQEAMAELRQRGRHGQLDAELVESFIAMLEREGPTFAHGDDADFETELAFERRVRKMAQPRSADASHALERTGSRARYAPSCAGRLATRMQRQLQDAEGATHVA